MGWGGCYVVRWVEWGRVGWVELGWGGLGWVEGGDGGLG